MNIAKAKEVLRIEAEGILSLIDQVGAGFQKAVDLIMACPSRVIITGIGKSNSNQLPLNRDHLAANIIGLGRERNR